MLRERNSLPSTPIGTSVQAVDAVKNSPSVAFLLQPTKRTTATLSYIFLLSSFIVRLIMYKLSVTICLLSLIGGCARSPVPGFDGSSDFISPQQVAALDGANDRTLTPSMSKPERNTYITGKLFIIDRDYAHYEQALTKGENSRKLFGSLATIGMSSAAAVIPLGATTKILNTTITAVQGAETSIDEDLLQQQAIQSIEKQMRTDRNNQAKLIFDRMARCESDQYPIYLALSDLEAYRQAGTFESAIIGLGKTTSAVEAASKDNKDSSSKAKPASPTALATLATLAPSTPSDFKCPIDTSGL